jgi:hypothetical protein
MNLTNWIKQIWWLPCAAGVILVSALVGCKRDSSRTYYAPKEDTQAPTPTQTAAPASANSQMPPQDMSVPSGLPTLNWTLPAGWQEKSASGMRAASFTAAGTNGQTADISVIPLPIIGHELELVNMWRQQVQLPPATQADADKSAEPVTIAGGQGKLFQFASEQPMIDGKFRAGILVAELTRGAMSWFFKMTGDESFVSSQKQNFVQFLKSVSFADQSAVPPHPLDLPQMTAQQPPAENSGKPTWAVPSGWQEVPPEEFLLAEYSIAGANGAKAEVNVAQLAGTGGGALANINRWRQQLGLSPATEDNLATMTSSLTASGGTASVVDMTGTDSGTGQKTRLVGVILPLGEQTWFYKLMGDEQIVAQQKDAFLKFVQSANYANAH